MTEREHRKSFKLKKHRVDMMNDKKLHIVPGTPLRLYLSAVPHKTINFVTFFRFSVVALSDVTVHVLCFCIQLYFPKYSIQKDLSHFFSSTTGLLAHANLFTLS